MRFNDQQISSLTRQAYGQEAILDIHDVAIDKFETHLIRRFVADLCDRIGMTRGPLYVWGDDKSLGTMHDPKADGISAIQFLHSSSITLHAIDELGKVFINVFSCKDFDVSIVRDFALDTFGGRIVQLLNNKRL